AERSNRRAPPNRRERGVLDWTLSAPAPRGRNTGRGITRARSPCYGLRLCLVSRRRMAPYVDQCHTDVHSAVHRQQCIVYLPLQIRECLGQCTTSFEGDVK